MPNVTLQQIEEHFNTLSGDEFFELYERLEGKHGKLDVKVKATFSPTLAPELSTRMPHAIVGLNPPSPHVKDPLIAQATQTVFAGNRRNDMVHPLSLSVIYLPVNAQIVSGNPQHQALPNLFLKALTIDLKTVDPDLKRRHRLPNLMVLSFQGINHVPATYITQASLLL